MNRIGIDVGGTFIKGGIIDGKGNILFSTKVPTFNNNEKISVVDNLYNLINYLLEKNKSINDVSPSFIGLGIQPPSPEWGAMLSDGKLVMLSQPWIVLPPGIAICITVASLTLIGDGLRDALDPKMKKW